MESSYCSKCKYYEIDINGDEKCNAPENKVVNRNYYHEWSVYLSKPNVINRNNDCDFFKERC
jgi:hypothetical protein